MKYYPPQHKQNKFHCPHCRVYAAQNWLPVFFEPNASSNFVESSTLGISECSHCEEKSYWYKERLVDPPDVAAPPPHDDLPEDCKLDYEEARNIFASSPRASAALLRLCVQKLLVHLGGNGKHINTDIKELVEKGLPLLVQQALDYCRVVGNNSVHPGEIDVNDSPDIAASLFDMINFIVQDRITRPKEIQALYHRLPESARKSIEQRDNTSGTT
ncbi:DUF4145 domain-containing protein [Pantanalinema sp. GBBB05]|uniref:DUF4145 domain-containing protein n=1 Tax=Pantanalinema sp. GBBB05 TaxID=2604139 RepID=UPI001D6BCC5C|nr:DUF4145 domain-containing protein [Pantanalinema sp. GBBB05]